MEKITTIIEGTRTQNEIRYNFETGRAVIYAKTEAEAQRARNDLVKRGLIDNRGTANTWNCR